MQLEIYPHVLPTYLLQFIVINDILIGWTAL